MSACSRFVDGRDGADDLGQRRRLEELDQVIASGPLVLHHERAQATLTELRVAILSSSCARHLPRRPNAARPCAADRRWSAFRSRTSRGEASRPRSEARAADAPRAARTRRNAARLPACRARCLRRCRRHLAAPPSEVTRARTVTSPPPLRRSAPCLTAFSTRGCSEETWQEHLTRVTGDLPLKFERARVTGLEDLRVTSEPRDLLSERLHLFGIAERIAEQIAEAPDEAPGFARILGHEPGDRVERVEQKMGFELRAEPGELGRAPKLSRLEPQLLRFERARSCASSAANGYTNASAQTPQWNSPMPPPNAPTGRGSRADRARTRRPSTGERFRRRRERGPENSAPITTERARRSSRACVPSHNRDAMPKRSEATARASARASRARATESRTNDVLGRVRAEQHRERLRDGDGGHDRGARRATGASRRDRVWRAERRHRSHPDRST